MAALLRPRLTAGHGDGPSDRQRLLVFAESDTTFDQPCLRDPPRLPQDASPVTANDHILGPGWFQYLRQGVPAIRVVTRPYGCRSPDSTVQQRGRRTAINTAHATSANRQPLSAFLEIRVRDAGAKGAVGFGRAQLGIASAADPQRPRIEAEEAKPAADEIGFDDVTFDLISLQHHGPEAP